MVTSVSPILWFSDNLERGLSDDVLKSKVCFLGLFSKYHEIMAHSKLAERAPSENHKIIEIEL